MDLSQEAMGVMNIMEGCVKKMLRDHGQQDDEMYSYCLGRFDSKRVCQSALVCLRGHLILQAIEADYVFDRKIRSKDMLMAHQRMKVRNWYVRGAINHIHSCSGETTALCTT